MFCHIFTLEFFLEDSIDLSEQWSKPIRLYICQYNLALHTCTASSKN